MEIGKSVKWVCGISANDFVGLGDFAYFLRARDGNRSFEAIIAIAERIKSQRLEAPTEEVLLWADLFSRTLIGILIGLVAIYCLPILPRVIPNIGGDPLVGLGVAHMSAYLPLGQAEGNEFG